MIGGNLAPSQDTPGIVGFMTPASIEPLPGNMAAIAPTLPVHTKWQPVVGYVYNKNLCSAHQQAHKKKISNPCTLYVVLGRTGTASSHKLKDNFSYPKSKHVKPRMFHMRIV